MQQDKLLTMANTCITNWALKGLSSTVGLIAAAIDNASSQPRPHPWDRPLLSEVGGLLGLPKEDMPYSEIVHCQTDGLNILRISTEEGGAPPMAFFEALKKKYPDLKVRYVAECFEDDLFETNDREGEFFPERYALDFHTTLAPDADPLYYFKSEKELLDFVAKTFGKKYDSADEVSSSLEYDLSDDDKNAFVSLHKADIVNTLR